MVVTSEIIPTVEENPVSVDIHSEVATCKTQNSNPSDKIGQKHPTPVSSKCHDKLKSTAEIKRANTKTLSPINQVVALSYNLYIDFMYKN